MVSTLLPLIQPRDRGIKGGEEVNENNVRKMCRRKKKGGKITFSSSKRTERDEERKRKQRQKFK